MKTGQSEANGEALRHQGARSVRYLETWPLTINRLRGIEWKGAIAHFPPSSGFGTLFFIMTGIHAFHVMSGLICLAILYLLGRKESFKAGGYWGVEGAVKYWHFMDVAWVVIYPTLYLVN